MQAKTSFPRFPVLAYDRTVHKAPYKVYSLDIRNAALQLPQHLPARNMLEAIIDVGSRHPARSSLACFDKAGNGIFHTEPVPVSEAPRKQKRINHLIQFSQQRALHDPVSQRRHRQPANSPRMLSDLDSHHRMRAERAISQRPSQVTNPAGSGVFELIDIRPQVTISKCRIPDLRPGIQKRLLSKRTRK